ncbi:MAG: N-acetylneuraminate synthase family protein [Nitrospirae bacterium]|nr:N-acetylneuraminate synthase family protein [Nitrospirota bacterium]
MKTTVALGNRLIGRGQPTLIVAEVGINHNGDPETAKAMIRTAAECGVDAVKFQTFFADDFVGDGGTTYTYVSKGNTITESMREMFRRYELPLPLLADLKAEADHAGVLFFSTPSSVDAVEALIETEVPCVKVGSDDLTNLPLLKDLARFRLPMILSTGMASEAEIRDAIRAVRSSRNSQIVLLHCVSLYPTPDLACNMRRISGLRRLFPYPVGYSDHTEGIEAARLATALGAVMIEKHFTLDKSLAGPDHAFSCDPSELRALVKAVRQTELMLGGGRIAPGPEEQDMKKLCRRSIVARVAIDPGMVIGRDMIALKRPGTGLSPSEVGKVIGRRSRRAILPDDLVHLSDLE